MKNIKIYNEELDLTIDLNVKDAWNEIKLTDYMKLVSLLESKDSLEDEEFLIKVLEVVSDAKRDSLLDIPVSEFNLLLESFSMYTNLDVTDVIQDYYIIEDKIFVPKKNMSNLTTSELIYLKQIQKEGQAIDIYLGMLSVLLRPGYKKEEDGKERWIMHKLNGEDIEDRKEFFREKLTASLAIPLIKAFTSGTKE